MGQSAAGPSDPDGYVDGLDGWQRACVRRLREAVRAVRGLEEHVKWGHLVYECGGPVLYVRADGERVLFGFWRGQRLTELEPRLEGGGRYEMARLVLRRGIRVDPAVARRLARRAVALNRELGDPRDAARGPGGRPGTRRRHA